MKIENVRSVRTAVPAEQSLTSTPYYSPPFSRVLRCELIYEMFPCLRSFPMIVQFKFSYDIFPLPSLSDIPIRDTTLRAYSLCTTLFPLVVPFNTRAQRWVENGGYLKSVL